MLKIDACDDNYDFSISGEFLKVKKPSFLSKSVFLDIAALPTSHNICYVAFSEMCRGGVF